MIKTSYFVWNREKKRYRIGKSPLNTEVPLYWAHNVRANKLSRPFANTPGEDVVNVGFVAIDDASAAIVKTDAIILQRTSNSRQKRRLVAGVIRQKNVSGNRGFVSENHTILILPTDGQVQQISLTALCHLLNSEPVDSRFRQISGTVSVSVAALKALPLPLASAVIACFANSNNYDLAAVEAYEKDAALKLKETLKRRPQNSDD